MCFVAPQVVSLCIQAWETAMLSGCQGAVGGWVWQHRARLSYGNHSHRFATGSAWPHCQSQPGWGTRWFLHPFRRFESQLICGFLLRDSTVFEYWCFSLRLSCPSIKMEDVSSLNPASSPVPLSPLEFMSYSRRRLLKGSNAILVTCVNSPVFQSGVISTFDMPVFL